MSWYRLARSGYSHLNTPSLTGPAAADKGILRQHTSLGLRPSAVAPALTQESLSPRRFWLRRLLKTRL